MVRLFLVFLLGIVLGPCTVLAQVFVESQTDVLFIDNYDPVVVSEPSGDGSVEVLSSTIQMHGDPPRPLDQVCVFQSTKNDPCGYFWPLSVGELLHLPGSGVVKLFVPLVPGNESGSAVVRVGDLVVTVDATANGIPVAPHAAALHVPAATWPRVTALSSDVSLIGQRGTDRDLDKVLVVDPAAMTPTSWVRQACVGDGPASFPSSQFDRLLYVFIVDHGRLDDNSGAVIVGLELDGVVGASTMTWGGVRSLYR